MHCASHRVSKVLVFMRSRRKRETHVSGATCKEALWGRRAGKGPPELSVPGSLLSSGARGLQNSRRYPECPFRPCVDLCKDIEWLRAQRARASALLCLTIPRHGDCFEGDQETRETHVSGVTCKEALWGRRAGKGPPELSVPGSLLSSGARGLQNSRRYPECPFRPCVDLCKDIEWLRAQRARASALLCLTIPRHGDCFEGDQETRETHVSGVTRRGSLGGRRAR